MIALRSAMGGAGGILVTDTTAITGEFKAIQALEDCTFTVLTTPEVHVNGVDTVATATEWGTIAEGSTLLTRITACTLATGKALLFK